VCNEIGARLGASRNQRRWTHVDVADRLLLSTAQVIGLEHADVTAFHNPAFFAVALRKYATLMAIECPEAILIPKSPPPNVRAASARESTAESENDSNASRFPFPMSWLAAVAVLLAGGVAMTVYIRGRTPPQIESAATLRVPPPAAIERTPPPLSFPAPEPAPLPPPAAPDPPAPQVAAPIGDGRAGLVTLARPAWVFVRYGDNSVVERVLQAGQSLALTSAPIYLAIGTGDGVTLTLGGRPIDLSPFRNGDEIRIRSNELADLAR
jgi:hypothetical protein